MTFKVETEVSDEQVLSLLLSAFSGGSAYWIESIKLIQPDKKWFPQVDESLPTGDFILKGGTAEIMDGEGEQMLVLTKDKIWHGVQDFSDNHPTDFADMLTENADQNTGDIFLQCCLFGKAIYG